ncbi:hypothetical protein HOM50_00595 [bacterium]|jgi:hypothetical protein|nr:hypothetical protein [bacterium]MBT5014889.1 hypothetical protein [bacterium]
MNILLILLLLCSITLFARNQFIDRAALYDDVALWKAQEQLNKTIDAHQQVKPVAMHVGRSLIMQFGSGNQGLLQKTSNKNLILVGPAAQPDLYRTEYRFNAIKPGKTTITVAIKINNGLLEQYEIKQINVIIEK